MDIFKFLGGGFFWVRRAQRRLVMTHWRPWHKLATQYQALWQQSHTKLSLWLAPAGGSPSVLPPHSAPSSCFQSGLDCTEPNCELALGQSCECKLKEKTPWSQTHTKLSSKVAHTGGHPKPLPPLGRSSDCSQAGSGCTRPSCEHKLTSTYGKRSW